MASNQVLLSCTNLTIGYGKKKNFVPLVNNFTYDFKSDSVYGIVGNSGVGKTTLISHFNGLLKSNIGDIRVKDMSILSTQKRIRNYKKIRKEVSLVFQEPQKQLFKDTVLKDVSFGPLHTGVTKDKAHTNARACLTRMGIDSNLFDENPFVLSNGQQRRVALAGCLAINPSIFIFDEPTAGLDPSGVKLMVDLILELKQQHKTVIVVSHDVDFLLKVCDEVILLHDKKVLISGEPYKVFNSSLLTGTHVKKPIVMQVIDLLVKNETKFSEILSAKPRTEMELASILKPMVGSKGGK